MRKLVALRGYAEALRGQDKLLLTVFLFSIFYLFTLVFSDRYDLWMLTYLTGILSITAVFRYKGPTTVLGFLVTVFVARYYFVPLFVKAAEGTALWDNLYSPTQTLFTLITALTGMLVASLFFRETSALDKLAHSLSERLYLNRLILIALVFGVFATIQAFTVQQLGGTGGFSGGLLKGTGPIFQALLAFSLSLAIYRALIQRRNPWTDPVVLMVLLINMAPIFLSISRGSLIIILVAVVAPYIFVKQRISLSVIFIAAAGILLFLFVVSPAVIYVRSASNVQFDSLGNRLRSMSSFWVDAIQDPVYFSQYRATISSQAYYVQYFNNYYGGLERFAILPDNDRLITGTTLSGQYGHWDTILWAIEMIPPRFLYPDKPFTGPGAYLGYIAGFAQNPAGTTQWAFGFPGEFYHAFSYPGVFLGTIALFSLFGLVLKLFVYLKISALWGMLLVVYYWNTFTEGSLATILSTLVPLTIFILIADWLIRSTLSLRFVVDSAVMLQKRRV